MTSKSKQVPKNNIEIRVIGQMRSGNHVIIDWLIGLYPGQSRCFLNNLSHGDLDPYEACDKIELRSIPRNIRIDELRRLNKDVIIYSYEDQHSIEAQSVSFLESVFHGFEQRAECLLGESKHKFDVLVIRDPFNLLASRLEMLRKRGPQGGIANMYIIKREWIALANYILDKKTRAGRKTIVIQYNKWLLDQNYRATIASQLSGKNWNKPLASLSLYGGSSSFATSLAEYHGKLRLSELPLKWKNIFKLQTWARLHVAAQRLTLADPKPTDFLSRWEILKNDKEYRLYAKDKKLLALSEKIFGKIEGIRGFVNS